MDMPIVMGYMYGNGGGGGKFVTFHFWGLEKTKHTTMISVEFFTCIIVYLSKIITIKMYCDKY